MIDFKNKSFFKLKPEDKNKGLEHVKALLIPGEEVVASYVSMRDRIVFTNKRIISINVQGLTGTKKDYTSIPYNRIQMYSVETAGLMDLDAELDLWISGIGKIRFEIKGSSNIIELCRVISELILM